MLGLPPNVRRAQASTVAIMARAQWKRHSQYSAHAPMAIPAQSVQPCPLLAMGRIVQGTGRASRMLALPSASVSVVSRARCATPPHLHATHLLAVLMGLAKILPQAICALAHNRGQEIIVRHRPTRAFHSLAIIMGPARR